MYIWPKSTQSWTFLTLPLTASDVTSLIQKSILDLLKKKLSQESSFMNFLYLLIASLWCYFSHTWANVWPPEHISGKLVLDNENFIHTHWLLFWWYVRFDLRGIFLAQEHSILNFLYWLTDTFWYHISHTVVHIWPNKYIFWPRSTQSWTFNTYSLIHSDATSAIYETILISRTNFWQISPQWWNFYTDSLTPSVFTSDRQKSIFDLLNIFLANQTSILNFLNWLIDSFWICFSHTEVHIRATEHISGKLVLDHELPIHTYWLHLMLDKPDSSPYLNDWTYI